MNIVKMMEEIAKNTHHHIEIDALLVDQPLAIRQAFYANDCSELKREMSQHSEIIANKCLVTNIEK